MINKKYLQLELQMVHLKENPKYNTILPNLLGDRNQVKKDFCVTYIVKNTTF